MSTLLIKDGFKFFFYANEHEPRHIHVVKGDGYFKVELANLVISNDHMKPKELKKALVIVETHKNRFLRQWDEYFS
jgi:hypothetical protein